MKITNEQRNNLYKIYGDSTQLIEQCYNQLGDSDDFDGYDVNYTEFELFGDVLKTFYLTRKDGVPKIADVKVYSEKDWQVRK
jgi:DNA polymerase III delta subunit